VSKEKIRTVPDRYIQSMAPLGAKCHALETKGLTKNDFRTAWRNGIATEGRWSDPDGPLIKARTAVCGQRVEEWVDRWIKGADPDGWDDYMSWVAWADEVSLTENAGSWRWPAKRCSRCARLVKETDKEGESKRWNG
jgi:hypothetical protein